MREVPFTRFKDAAEAASVLAVVGCRTQVSLVRNLAHEIFPPQMKEREAKRLSRTLAAFFRDTYEAEDVTEDRALKATVGPQYGLAAVADRGPAYRLLRVQSVERQVIWIEVMSANHLTFSITGIFWDFETRVEVLQAFVDAVGKKIAFAYDPAVGYLATQIPLIGTGLRIRTWMHLNALSRYRHLEALSNAMEAYGVFVEMEEDVIPDGHLFILFNQGAIHASPVEIVSSFWWALALVAHHEMKCRMRMYKESPYMFHDILETARAQMGLRHLLSEREAFHALSDIQMAASVRVFKAGTIQKLLGATPWHWAVQDNLLLASVGEAYQRAVWETLPPSLQRDYPLSLMALRARWARQYAQFTYTKHFLNRVKSV